MHVQCQNPNTLHSHITTSLMIWLHSHITTCLMTALAHHFKFDDLTALAHHYKFDDCTCTSLQVWWFDCNLNNAIEIDCEDLTILSLLLERPLIRAEIGHLVDEIVELIGNFQFVFCNHIPKDCNLLACALPSDTLAKVGPSVCFKDYLSCLQTLFISKLHHQ